jgi:prepilin-type processing-associated H-X9-DG protein
LSYDYPTTTVADKTREQVRLGRIVKLDNSGNIIAITESDRSSTRVLIVYDFTSFHGSPGDDGATNFLYLDGHVDALIVTDTN